MSENIGAVGTAAIETAPAATEAAPAKETAPQGEKAPVAAKPVPPPAPRHKLKVDGREEEVDEPELIRRAQRVSAADRRLEEIAKKQENIGKFLQTVKGDPIAALLDPALGLTKQEIQKAVETWYKREVIDPEMLTPEQRRIRELETEKQGWTREQEAKKQAQLAEQTEVQKKHWIGEYETQITKGLESSSLPKNTSTVRAMASYMEQANRAGIDVPIETIANLVKQDKLADTHYVLSSMEGEQLIKYVGEEIINKIRKADLARMRGGAPKPESAAAAPNLANEPNRGQGKPVSMADARKYFDTLK